MEASTVPPEGPLGEARKPQRAGAAFEGRRARHAREGFWDPQLGPAAGWITPCP